MGTTVRFDLPLQTQQFEQVQRRYPDIARLIEDVATADRRGPGMTRLLRSDTFAAMQAVMAAYPVLWKAVCKLLPVLADPALARVYAQFAWTYPKLEAAMAGVFAARRKNPTAAVRSPLVDPILRSHYGQALSRFPALSEVFQSFASDPVLVARKSLTRPEWIPTQPKRRFVLTSQSADVFPPAGPDRPFLRCNEAFALRERNAGNYMVFNTDGSDAKVRMSEVPRAEWEFRSLDGKAGPVVGGASYGLFNRAANKGKGAYLTFGNLEAVGDDIGRAFRWSSEPPTLSTAMAVEGQPPFIKLGPLPDVTQTMGRNLCVKNDGESIHYLGKTSALFNWVTVRQALPSEQVSLMPCLGDFAPGESLLPGQEPTGNRPESWIVEQAGQPYPYRNAYLTLLRSPYLQNVCSTSATVCFRIASPQEFVDQRYDDVTIAKILGLEAWVAPAWIDLSRQDPSVKKVDFASKDDFNKRDCLEDYDEAGKKRPRLEFLVTFRGLRPATCYHYRIKCGLWSATAILHDKPILPDLKTTHVAYDVAFETPSPRFPTSNEYQSSPLPNRPTTFVSMGDYGNGRGPPNWIYDVNDAFHWVARAAGVQSWLALGDIDNRYNGNPDSLDPFFFGLFNAYGRPNGGPDDNAQKYTTPHAAEVLKYWPSPTDSDYCKAGTPAFREPAYLGVLGGLACYPTPGNHDVGSNPGALDGTYTEGQWSKCIPSFIIPPTGDDEFTSINLAPAKLIGDDPVFKDGQGTGQIPGPGYAFRQGNVLLFALPAIDEVEWESNLRSGTYGTYHKTQAKVARRCLEAQLKDSPPVPGEWLIVFCHSNHWGYGNHIAGEFAPDLCVFKNELVSDRTDLFLSGHAHLFRHDNRPKTEDDNLLGQVAESEGMRAIICGTAGFGDSDDPCLRPGFVLARIFGNVLEYWKIDSNRCQDAGFGYGREEKKPRIMEYCRVFKHADGTHTSHEMLLDVAFPPLLHGDRTIEPGEMEGVRCWDRAFERPSVMGRWLNIGRGDKPKAYEDHLVYLYGDRILRWRTVANGKCQCWVHKLNPLNQKGEFATNWNKIGSSKDPDQLNWCDPLFEADGPNDIQAVLPECPIIDHPSRYAFVHLGTEGPKANVGYLLVWRKGMAPPSPYSKPVASRTIPYWIYRVTDAHDAKGTSFVLKFQGSWEVGKKRIDEKHELLFLGQFGGKSYVMDWEPQAHKYRVWRFHWESPTLTDDPLAGEVLTSKFESCVDNGISDFRPDDCLVGLADETLTMVLERWSGRTRFVRWIQENALPFGGGYEDAGPDARISAFQDETEFVYLGKDRGMLSWDPRSGRYSIRRKSSKF